MIKHCRRAIWFARRAARRGGGCLFDVLTTLVLAALLLGRILIGMT